MFKAWLLFLFYVPFYFFYFQGLRFILKIEKFYYFLSYSYNLKIFHVDYFFGVSDNGRNVRGEKIFLFANPCNKRAVMARANNFTQIIFYHTKSIRSLKSS